MKKLATAFVITIFIAHLSIGQKRAHYQANQIINATELDLNSSEKRGIRSEDGTIFYVEKNMTTLTAVKNDKVKWRKNMLNSFTRRDPGTHFIRYLKLESDTLFVVFAKHTFYYINIKDGKVISLGAD